MKLRHFVRVEVHSIYKSNGEIAYKPEEVDESLGKGGNAYGIAFDES